MGRNEKPRSVPSQAPKAEPVATAGGAGKEKRNLFKIGGFLAAVTFIVFWGVLSSSFISMDDGAYVTDNARVQKGLTAENIKWAFTTNHFGFYYPMTWLSHMLDCQLYGMKAGGHHFTSLLIHVVNTLLLLFLLHGMTGSVWRSGFVAALFAIHPLHVESVAWISERKDVLCSFFWLLALIAYVRYAERPSPAKYGLLLLAFLSGLLSKPMILTFPFTLLLLDYWPLRRWRPAWARSAGEEGRATGNPAALKDLVFEKLPLFFLVPVFAFIAMAAQKDVGATSSLEVLPLSQRVANALLSYVLYLKKMIFPFDLAGYYPLPSDDIPAGTAMLCGLLLALLTGAALWFGLRRKYLATGWLWYLGILVPVIGLVQIGGQAMADRYTYISLIGIFVIVVWLGFELAARGPLAGKIMIGFAAAALVFFAAMSVRQVGFWKDSFVVSQRALAVTKDNWFMEVHMGCALCAQGKKDEAEPHFLEALRVNPGCPDAHMNIANLLAEKGGHDEEALVHYEEALKNKPDSADILSNMAVTLMKVDRLPEAVEKLRKAVKIAPDHYAARIGLGRALSRSGLKDEAVEQFREALRINRDSQSARAEIADTEGGAGASPGGAETPEGAESAKTLNSLGVSLARAGQTEEAIEKLREAVRLDPGFYDARCNLGTALAQSGKMEEAIGQFAEAVRINPRSAQAPGILGTLFMQAGKLAEASEQFSKAVEAEPGSEKAHINLGVVLGKMNRYPEAAECFRKALEINSSSQAAKDNLARALEAQAGKKK